MARSVSETLKAAQYATSRTPYIHLVFTSYDGGTTYDLSLGSADYGSRIILVDHSEEAYNEYAVIVLRNYDRGLPSDLTGFWTEIGYGDVTGGGNEYESTPRLWVKHHQEVSAGGRLLTILELEGMWAKMRETKMLLGNPPYYNATYTGETPYALIGLIFSELDPAFSLQALAEDDGIMNTYKPSFSVNDVELFEDAASLLYRLVKMTKSFLRPKPSLEFEVKFPQSSDSNDLTYYSSKAPYFKEYSNRENLLVPNHIYLVANAGEDGLWTDVIVVEASNSESIGKYGDVPDVVLAPEITSGGDAENRAAAVLARVNEEEQAGVLVTQHDCRVELYDRVGVEDSRGY
jgi:hypothetical protein